MNREEQIEFIAGFFDGDGCVRLQKRASASSECCLIQSKAKGIPPELEYIDSFYTGSLARSKVGTATRRPCWTFVLRGEERNRFFEDIAGACIVKYPQVEAAYVYEKNGRENNQWFYEFLRDAKKRYHQVRIDESRLTLPYIAGLFAAEGSAGIYARHGGKLHSLAATITQIGCERLMHAIRDKIGFGSVHKGRLHFACKAAARFLRKIRPYLIGQKREQVKVALRFQRKIRHPRGQRIKKKQTRRMKRYADKLKKLKRL